MVHQPGPLGNHLRKLHHGHGAHQLQHLHVCAQVPRDPVAQLDRDERVDAVARHRAVRLDLRRRHGQQLGELLLQAREDGVDGGLAGGGAAQRRLHVKGVVVAAALGGGAGGGARPDVCEAGVWALRGGWGGGIGGELAGAADDLALVGGALDGVVDHGEDLVHGLRADVGGREHIFGVIRAFLLHSAEGNRLDGDALAGLSLGEAVPERADGTGDALLRTTHEGGSAVQQDEEVEV
ncbi:hypothetical protein MKX07_001306 [Trichoderma sp. CBMAI-0711]|nr:hypothetical protein MKX07_001306 [Trichoderma sp. CBMAI-0711]